jgi:hypothetical protein
MRNVLVSYHCLNWNHDWPLSGSPQTHGLQPWTCRRMSIFTLRLLRNRVRNKAVPVQAWAGPGCSRRLFPDFKKVVRLPTLRTGRLYPRRSVNPRAVVLPEVYIRNSIDLIGKRIHNLPACTAVSQPTAPPRTNVHTAGIRKIYVNKGTPP